MVYFYGVVFRRQVWAGQLHGEFGLAGDQVDLLIFEAVKYFRSIDRLQFSRQQEFFPVIDDQFYVFSQPGAGGMSYDNIRFPQ